MDDGPTLGTTFSVGPKVNPYRGCLGGVSGSNAIAYVALTMSARRSIPRSYTNPFLRQFKVNVYSSKY